LYKNHIDQCFFSKVAFEFKSKSRLVAASVRGEAVGIAA
jgi:hypothetical protein